MVQKGITVLAEHDVWLKENCINLSRLVRKYIILEMAAQNVSKIKEEKNCSDPSSKLSSSNRSEAD